MRIRDLIIPEDKVFFDYFEEIIRIIRQASALLLDQTQNLSHCEINFRKIHNLEHQSDDILKKIYERLEQSLVTPLEPDEIARLAKALDDVIDAIDWVSQQICNYRITESNPSLEEFASLITITISEIERGVYGLRDIPTIQDIKETKELIGRIHQMYNLSSDLLSSSVSDLFESNDPMNVMKLKDIYENMEEILQECNDVGHVLGEISIRHS